LIESLKKRPSSPTGTASKNGKPTLIEAKTVIGQAPIRTGLTKVGLPSAPEGMPIEDPTIAALLKNHGYMTGQFGKNYLGDRNEHLPTNHGFDEFFGNLLPPQC